MVPGHHLSGTKILNRRKIMRCLPNFLMREAMNAILGSFRLPAVAIIKLSSNFGSEFHPGVKIDCNYFSGSKRIIQFKDSF